MKTIEERAWEKYPEVIKHHNLAHIDINEEKRKMYIEIATEQKAIDDAELLKLKSAWEKEAQINHDVEANYKQGYHDAVEKVSKFIDNCPSIPRSPSVVPESIPMRVTAAPMSVLAKSNSVLPTFKRAETVSLSNTLFAKS